MVALLDFTMSTNHNIEISIFSYSHNMIAASCWFKQTGYSNSFAKLTFCNPEFEKLISYVSLIAYFRNHKMIAAIS